MPQEHLGITEVLRQPIRLPSLWQNHTTWRAACQRKSRQLQEVSGFQELQIRLQLLYPQSQENVPSKQKGQTYISRIERQGRFFLRGRILFFYFVFSFFDRVYRLQNALCIVPRGVIIYNQFFIETCCALLRVNRESVILSNEENVFESLSIRVSEGRHDLALTRALGQHCRGNIIVLIEILKLKDKRLLFREYIA